MKKRSMTTILISAAFLMSAVGCSAVRNSRAETPPPPDGPVRTVSPSGDLLPEGTRVTVRTNENIESESAGGTFDAQVAREVVSTDYDVVVPEGSPAELAIVRTDRGGTVGTPEIELALESITVNGIRYAVNSAGNTQQGDEGLGNNERTATMVGGGAILGTVIGAIAGGAQGAAIGAAVGAAGGAAGQVLTRGKEVHVPAETLLAFEIQQPIQLRN